MEVGVYMKDIEKGIEKYKNAFLHYACVKGCLRSIEHKTSQLPYPQAYTPTRGQIWRESGRKHC